MERQIYLPEIAMMVDDFVAKNPEILDPIDFIVGVSRGGLVPAALIAAKINKPLVAVYIDKNDKIHFDRLEWLKGKNILVVDDIIRSGKTLWLVREFLAKNAALASVSFFTLFKVLPLAKKEFALTAFSSDCEQDVVFPWDNQI